MSVVPALSSVASVSDEAFRISYTHRQTAVSGGIQLSDSFAFLGRHPLNSLALNDPSVSRRHAYVQIVDRGVYVVDLNSRTGLQIAGVSSTEGWVSPGQALRIGEYNVEFHGPFDSAEGRPSPLSQISPENDLVLAFAHENDHHRQIFSPIRNPMTLIGKDPRCNLRLIDPRIVSFHASILKTDRDVYIVSIPGNGGVRINDRLVKSSMLRVGDRVSLNGLNLEVQLNRKGIVPLQKSPLNISEEVSELLPFAVSVNESQPLAEQVSELRQATMMMASLFAEMKREQSQMMQRQMELMEMMTQAFREARSWPPAPQVQASAGAVYPAVSAVDSKPITPLQVPHLSDPADEAKLAQAHDWFLAKLGKMKPNS